MNHLAQTHSETGYQVAKKSWKRYEIWLASNWRRAVDTWRIFSNNKLAVFGLFLIMIYALMAVAHPILMATVWPKGIYDPQVGYDLKIFSHPSPPSATHLLGTDTLGRDVLSMLLAATTPTYVLALTAAIATAIVSTLAGAIAAYYGGLTDLILSLLSDIALLLPAPLVMVVIGGTIDISPFQFGLLYGLLAGIGGAAIVMRSQALTLASKPFVEAARVAGGNGPYIILKHLTPNMLPLASVQMLLSVTGVVFADGFGSFLGLSRTRLNWGSMIYSSFINQNINSTITWNVLIPSAITISLFAASFYFVARGLHEVAEPRLRSR
jgi:peptide/nickel transport system permease protein